jgi:site-specific DNA recombinase
MRPETEWIAISVPAIVSAEVFEQAQQQLARNRATLSGRPGHRFYLLRGLLRCGACGRRVFGIPMHGRRFYKCSGRDRLRGDERCRAATISAEKLETFLWETVVSVLKNPTVLSEKLEHRAVPCGPREVEVRSEGEHLARQLTDLERQAQRLLDLYLEEQLAVPSLKSRLAELATRKTNVEERLAATRRVADLQHAQQAHQDAIRAFCAQALRGLAKLTPEGRQRLLRALVDEIVLRGTEIEIHGVLPGRWIPPNDRNRSHAQHVVDSYEPKGYLLVVHAPGR